MAVASSIDVDATQHLRDILKLDRSGDSLMENQQKASPLNIELNGFRSSDYAEPENPEPDLQQSSVRNTGMLLFSDRQVICLTGDDSSTSIEIIGTDVEIVASNDSDIGSKARGSNKVTIQPVAKYDWEQKYYYGNLIAVSNAYLAYATRGSNGSAMIRVLSVKTAERILLKGITGSVTDLAFAHLNSNQLSCLDEAGSLFVWRLTMENGKIQDEILVHIRQPGQASLTTYRRIIWCPYIAEDNEDISPEDTSQTVALLHEDRAEVWDLEILRANHNSWPTNVSDIKEGFIVVKGHSGRLSEGALSPDGTVLATASHDGFVKFWQIYIEGQDEPRCLHEWKPHSGRPVSCLLFCDNHKKQDPDVPFWRFLITGADQNRQLKMWCTVSWTCLQTIHFSPDPFSSNVLPGLKVCLDLSAEYLILTDVQRKVLYVMELKQNHNDGRAAFTSVSEFLLTHPVLSFGIQDVCLETRCAEVLTSDADNDRIGAETLDSDEGNTAVLIKLFCVHTKALQDVQIRFKPHLGTFAGFSQTSNHNFKVPQDKIIDITQEKKSNIQSLHGSQNDLLKTSSDFLLLPTDSKPKLMTPDAFMVPSVPISQVITEINIGSCTAVTPVNTISVGDTVVSRHTDEDPLQGIITSPALQLESGVPLNNSQSGIFSSSTRSPTMLIPVLSEKKVTPTNMPLELQSLESSVSTQASPTRERSPDVISSASTAVSQDIPEIASDTLQRSYPGALSMVLTPEDPAPSMSSAASALHIFSKRNTEHAYQTLETESYVEDVLISNQPLNDLKTQENVEEEISQLWPAAPDITRETMNSLEERPVVNLMKRIDTVGSASDPYGGMGNLIPVSEQDEAPRLANVKNNSGTKCQSPRLLKKDWKTRDALNPSPNSCKKFVKEKPLIQSQNVQAHQASNGELMSLLYSQRKELSELRQNQLELMQRLADHFEMTQSSIMRHVDHAMVTHQDQEQRRLDYMLSKIHQNNDLLQEQISQHLSQSLPGSLSSRLEKTIREEIKKTVPLCVTKVLEPVTGQLGSTIAAKLTSVEGVIKDSVTKMVKSKNITDAIGRALVDSLQVPIQAAYRETFQLIMLPAFEKACQCMFQQINNSFRQGTEEYMQQLETHLKSRKGYNQEAFVPVLKQFQQLIDCLQMTADQLTSKLSNNVRTEIQHQIHVAVGNVQESILTNVQRIIKEEVNHALKVQQASVTSSIMHAIRSTAGTPIPSSHFDFHSQQAHILQLLQQGHLNQAFQQALTASDLNLILYVCETVDSQQVFGQLQCPLTQPVLLSLIQQLSFDLGTRTELKLNYLEEAVMHLDHSDPVTRDHMDSVMTQVRQKLFQFLQVEKSSPSQKLARRLMIMLQGLISPNMN